MNSSGGKRNDYFVDRYGNVYTRDGKYVGKVANNRERSGNGQRSGANGHGYGVPRSESGQRTQGTRQGTGYANPYRNPYGEYRTGNAQKRKKRRGPDPRLGIRDRSRVTHEKKGIREFKGAPSTEIQKKRRDILVIASVVVVVAILLAVILKFAFTEHIEDLPDAPKKESTAAENAESQAESQAESDTDAPDSESVKYAEYSQSTVQLGANIDCTHAILIDTEKNSVVADKGGEERIYPASMTKVMTALVAVEKCESLDETFAMTNEIIAPLAAANASVAGFAPGEVITVRDLLYGTLLPSGADATGGLAVLIAGSEENFASLMNEKCSELGLVGTHFTNASGLHDDNHYSTCHDIALIMEAALENETLKEILGTYEYVTSKTPEHPEGITLYDTMFSRVEGKEEFDDKIEIFAGKTGFTGEAGNCLVSAAKVVGEDKVWIFVCAGGESKWKPIYDTIHVYRTYLGVAYDGEYIPKYMR